MKIRKMIVSLGVLMISVALLSCVTAFAANDDYVNIGDKYTGGNLNVNVVDYAEEEYDITIDDINRLIADNDYAGVAKYIGEISSDELEIRVLDYLGIYYPVVYTAVVSDDQIAIDVTYLGSFIGKDENGEPIEGDVSVALYNTVTAYKAGLISNIKWTMSGAGKEYTTSLPGSVLDSDAVEKTVNGEGSVSFGLVVRGAYFEEDDMPEITADVTLNSTDFVN